MFSDNAGIINPFCEFKLFCNQFKMNNTWPADDVDSYNDYFKEYYNTKDTIFNIEILIRLFFCKC